MRRLRRRRTRPRAGPDPGGRRGPARAHRRRLALPSLALSGRRPRSNPRIAVGEGYQRGHTAANPGPPSWTGEAGGRGDAERPQRKLANTPSARSQPRELRRRSPSALSSRVPAATPGGHGRGERGSRRGTELRREGGGPQARGGAQRQEDRLAPGRAGVEGAGLRRIERAALDPGEPGGEVALVRRPGSERGRERGRQIGMCADADAQHGRALPVAPVVDRLGAGPRVARDLVAGQAAGLEARPRGQHHVRDPVVVRHRDAAAADGGRQGRARLHGQRITRDVLGTMSQRGVHVGEDVGLALAGDAEDQVEGELVEAGRARRFEGGVALPRPVPPGRASSAWGRRTTVRPPRGG